jgi:hypothetical protein
MRREHRRRQSWQHQQVRDEPGLAEESPGERDGRPVYVGFRGSGRAQTSF